MSKITIEVQTPKRAATFAHDVAMPSACSDAAALAIGHGLTAGERLRDGRRKYLWLRQILLDEMAASMATNRKFKEVRSCKPSNGPPGPAKSTSKI